jgi:hypothetical protein
MISKQAEWHTCACIKVNDAKAIDPRTGLSLFGDPDKPGYQGLNHLFVMKMVMHRETKDLVYGSFQDFYDFWESCQSENMNPLSPGRPVTMFTTKCDLLSLTWKGLARGGAAKVATFASHCCDINMPSLAKPNAVPCRHWCGNNTEWHFQCYHHDIVGEEALKEKRLELMELKKNITRSINDIDVNLRMLQEDFVVATKASAKNIKSIHFDLPGNKKVGYLALHWQEVQL